MATNVSHTTLHVTDISCAIDVFKFATCYKIPPINNHRNNIEMKMVFTVSSHISCTTVSSSTRLPCSNGHWCVKSSGNWYHKHTVNILSISSSVPVFPLPSLVFPFLGGLVTVSSHPWNPDVHLWIIQGNEVVSSENQVQHVEGNTLWLLDSVQPASRRTAEQPSWISRLLAAPPLQISVHWVLSYVWHNVMPFLCYLWIAEQMSSMSRRGSRTLLS